MRTLLDAPLGYDVGDRLTHAPLVEAVVDGIATRLVVDTGASEHLLARWLAERLGGSLEPGEAGTDAAGALVESQLLRGVLLSVGGRPRPAADLIVIEGPAQFAGWGIGGILSPQALAGSGVVILDLAADRLTVLASQADSDEWLAARYPGRRPIVVEREPDDVLVVRAAIAPYEPVRTLIDTGARLTSFAATALPGLRGSGSHAGGTSVSGSQQIGQQVVDQRLVVGNGEVEVARLLLVDSLPGVGGLVGMDVLRGSVFGFGAHPTLPLRWLVGGSSMRGRKASARSSPISWSEPPNVTRRTPS